jgi:cytidine deaminase
MEDELFERARALAQKAYAPYSGYHVGCALLTASGQVFDGCNVENVSFAATLCAERTAIGKMVAAGERKIQRLVVYTQDGGPPCGVCLQTIAEFALPDTTVTTLSAGGEHHVYRLDELMPHGFASNQVNRTERS